MIFKLHQYFNEFRKGVKIKGSFTRNLAMTFSGNAVSTVVGFAFTPFIARVYGPEIYGVFALFMAIVSNIVPFSTMQFPSGFVAAKTDNEFYDLVKLTLALLFLGTLLSIIIIFFFQQSIFRATGTIELGVFAWFIPVYFFFMGLDNLLTGWNIRLKEFGRSALTKVISVAFSKGCALVAGIVQVPTPFGMILGNLLIYPLDSGLKISSGLLGDFANLRKHSHETLWHTLTKFRGYPLYITPGLIINSLSSQLPIYFFSLAFAPAYSGYFALAGSLVLTPMAIIINSSTTVFLQKAAEILQTFPERLGSYVLDLHNKLFLISLVSLTVFSLVSKWVFSFVFGDQWEQAGVFASFLAISAILTVPTNPLMVIFRLMFRERINFFINIIFVFLKMAVLWLGAVYYADILISIVLFCGVTIISQAVYLFYIFKLTNLNLKIVIRDFVIVSILFAILVLLNL
jgi:O-antigen/teichoic acid export membrane protein